MSFFHQLPKYIILLLLLFILISLSAVDKRCYWYSRIAVPIQATIMHTGPFLGQGKWGFHPGPMLFPINKVYE
jgi:hypothetical protein